MSQIREIICIDLDLNLTKLGGIGYPLFRVYNGNLYPADIDGVPVLITDEDVTALKMRGINVFDVRRY